MTQSIMTAGQTTINCLITLIRGIVHRGLSSVLFFSSRRRHTRLQGDWSSDVCSSDLAGDEPRFSCLARRADAVPVELELEQPTGLRERLLTRLGEHRLGLLQRHGAPRG